MAMEAKLKHLEFIQNVINRMGRNSFLLKGWGITLISALFALAVKDANVKFIYVSFIALPIFWILDGFFIAVERRFRDLYKEVSNKKENEIDFSMDTEKYKNNRSWICGIFSNTLILFYGILIATTFIVMYLIN